MYNPKLNLDNKNKHESYNQKVACPINICYDTNTKLPIQLKYVEYRVNVQLGLAVVQITQNYSTELFQSQSELEYLFTIDQNSVVSQMIVELGDQKLFGIIKELEEAKDDYKKGVKDGKTMVLSEEISQISNIKKVKIGCLNPGKSLKIIFEYIQPLQIFLNQFWKLELSPMIDASYLTNYQLKNTYDNYNILYSMISKEVNLVDIQQNYKQQISVEINMNNPITYVYSPTHQIQLNQDINSQNEKQTDCTTLQNNLIITLDNNNPENMAPNRKFELLFTSKEINKPHAILSHTNNDALQHIKYCATLTFIPKFNEFPIDDAYQSYISGLNLPSQTKFQKGTYLFFIDRSGSMRNQRIKNAKQSLVLFLKSLPEDSFFNVISFGSKSELMFSTSQPYNQTTLNQAIRQVEEMYADFGGTNILNALQKGIYDENYSKKNNDNLETLNAFILTDGEDSPDEIIQLVIKNQRPETRIYTLGIGDDCSEYLVKKLAEVGNGKCQLVRDNDDINSKVIDLLDDSLTQYLKGFSLTHNIKNVSQIIPDPQSITLLKKNEELTLQILFSKTSQNKVLDFKINCYDPQTNKQISYEVKLNLNESQSNEYFHKLAAHKMIRFYEKSQFSKDQILNTVKINQKCLNDQDIINLSLENQILCSKTAFICEVCQNEPQIKKLIKKKVIIYKEKMEQNLESQQCQDKKTRLTMKTSRIPDLCVLDIKQGWEINLDCLRNNSQKKKELQSKSLESIQEKEDQNKKNKFLPKQSIQCMLQPKVLDSEYQIISYIELIDCVQANGSFLLEIHVEEQLKICQLNNKFNIQDQCWSTILALFYLETFCQPSKSSWQLIYNKAISYLQKQGINYFLLKKESICDYEKLFQNQIKLKEQ